MHQFLSDWVFFTFIEINGRKCIKIWYFWMLILKKKKKKLATNQPKYSEILLEDNTTVFLFLAFIYFRLFLILKKWFLATLYEISLNVFWIRFQNHLCILLPFILVLLRYDLSVINQSINQSINQNQSNQSPPFPSHIYSIHVTISLSKMNATGKKAPVDVASHLYNSIVF